MAENMDHQNMVVKNISDRIDDVMIRFEDITRDFMKDYKNLIKDLRDIRKDTSKIEKRGAKKPKKESNNGDRKPSGITAPVSISSQLREFLKNEIFNNEELKNKSLEELSNLEAKVEEAIKDDSKYDNYIAILEGKTNDTDGLTNKGALSLIKKLSGLRLLKDIYDGTIGQSIDSEEFKIPRTNVNKLLSTYIDFHGLKDKDDGRVLILEGEKGETLKNILSPIPKEMKNITFFNMQSYLKVNYTKSGVVQEKKEEKKEEKKPSKEEDSPVDAEAAPTEKARAARRVRRVRKAVEENA